MKKILIIFITLFIKVNLFSADTEKEIQSKITRVTVFLHGAQITREAETTLLAGKTVLKLTGISPFVDERSLQVRGEGAFTVLSVNYRKDFLSTFEEIPEVRELIRKIENVEKVIEDDRNVMEILREKESFLLINKNIGGKDQALNAESFRLFFDVYGKNVEQIKTSLLQKQRAIRENDRELARLRQQLSEYQSRRETPKSEIFITVSSKTQLNGKFIISYLVDGAGWFPTYDIRVDNLDNPVSLVYKANVFQNTGVEWRNVLLTFSNASPNKSGNVPVPYPYYLDFVKEFPVMRSLAPTSAYSGTANGIVRDQDGKPLQGVSVNISGTSIGTITDSEGRFNLNIPAGSGLLEFNFVGFSRNVVEPGQNLNVVLFEDQLGLNEMMITGYGTRKKSLAAEDAVLSMAPSPSTIPLDVEVGDKRTSVEFNIEVPYTIPSEAKSTAIDMLNLSLPAEFQYQSVPRLDQDAFLVSKVWNWEQYDLLEGEANLYFENTFVGKSVLNTRFVSDTLDVSLGRDMGIVVKREKRKEFTSQRFIGNNKIETHSWEISVRNNKKGSIRIEVTDQVPVSQNKDIQVEILELSGGVLDRDRGFVKWVSDLAPGQTKIYILTYSVRYPRDRNVIVE